VAATVALTFDDGPNPDATRRILRLLERRDVKATFFVWGERAAQHPDVVGEILAAGHSLQPHCWSHVSHWQLEPDAIRADIDRVCALLAELGAPAPALWRPPYGRLRHGASSAIAAERGLALAGWTVNTADWEGRDAAAMHAEVAAALAAQEHAVVLLHDGHRESGPVPRRPDAGNTVELVRLLLDEEGDRRFTPLREGLAAGLEEGPP
jgi:peptidoglycan-N-acetylglucosamine deacetylase